MRPFAICCAVTFILLLASANAATYTVHPDGSGDYPTIQAAIDAAFDGDIIELIDGTFSGDGNRDLDYLGMAIVVCSQSDNPRACIIECDAHAADPHRGVYFRRDEGAGSVLRGVTIRHACYPQGGAIMCENGASPTITNCIFRDNVSSDSYVGGGAIWCEGEPTISECLFEANTASRGGAVFCVEYVAVTFEDCIFRANYASNKGGAVYSYQNAVFMNCIFEDNEAGDEGGAMLGGSLILEECTFYGNSATNRASALLCLDGYSDVQFCTLFGNSSANGAAIHCLASTNLSMSNTIIAYSDPGSAVNCDGVPDIELSCCDVFGNAGGDYIDCIANQLGIYGNISLDPILCGPAWGDYHPQVGSPCAPYSDPNPECDRIGAWSVDCSTSQAACCVGDVCQLLDAESCFIAGGQWLDGISTCDPTPCPPMLVHVEPDGSGDYDTIQMAIDACAEGGVVELADGIYQGDGNRDLNFHRKPITLRSERGFAELCIIDCQGTPEEGHRGFYFTVEGPETRLEDLTITNGYATIGAAILCRYGANPTIVDCIISANDAATTGGGICLSGSSPLIQGCKFLDNTAPDGGGGMYSSSSSPSIHDCEFIDNLAPDGGGGVFYAGSGVCSLSRCVFIGNMALSGRGGGVLGDGGGAIIDTCAFVKNISPEGGAIAADESEVFLSSCTFYANHASHGAGIWSNNGEASINHTIIAFSTHGEAIYCAGGFSVLMDCCDVYGNAGGDYVGCIDWLLGFFGNISVDPLLCDPEGGNYYLQEDSPCAPYTPPNPECDLIGAYPADCAYMGVPETPAEVMTPFTFDCSPNPSSSSVRLVYSIPDGPKDVLTQLNIFDITGRHVETLVDGMRSPGTHEIVWTALGHTGNALPAGVYFHVLQAGERTLTRRVLLMR